MKRQNSHLSSTSRRENSPESIRAKSIGCMSGIIHLLSKYQNRHKKSLTFGKNKEEKNIVVTASSPSNQTLVSATNKSHSSSSTPSPQKQRKSRNDKEGKVTSDVDHRRFSCELPSRSPILSAEIRRSNSVNSPTPVSSGSRSPGLIPRLMGLEAATPSPAAAETSSEKRRKLLGALEKCDNDLKALKDIIVAYRSTEIDEKFMNEDKIREQQLSPASVLNDFNGLHFNRINTTSKARQNGEEEEIKKVKKKVGAKEEKLDYSLNLSKLEKRIKVLQISRERSKPWKVIIKKKTDDDDHPPPPLMTMMTWRSKAMIESLNEICKEISWGCNLEMGRIGMALQHHIYKDLIEEMVTDFGFISSCFTIDDSLPPFEACRRRLRF